MENYKIRVESEAESKEAQELFFELGCSWSCGYAFFKNQKSPCLFVNKHNQISHIEYDTGFFEKQENKEITIQQLKDLVVLKRGDVDDATHTCDGAKYYLTASEFFEFINNHWENVDEYVDGCTFKPIDPKMSILDTRRLEMKEFLEPMPNGEYRYQKDEGISIGGDWIEIPACSEAAYFFNGSDLKRGKDDIAFYKDNIGSVYNDGDWLEIDSEKVKPFVLNKGVLLWKRHTQPEALPFVDDEPTTEDFIFNPSISDQYAEIEKVRQKHSHYKKDISHLDVLDIYRIDELFNPHPCGSHIAKKALCSGHRGHKDLLTDIQDIIDTAERWKQMLIEDGNS